MVLAIFPAVTKTDTSFNCPFKPFDLHDQNQELPYFLKTLRLCSTIPVIYLSCVRGVLVDAIPTISCLSQICNRTT